MLIEFRQLVRESTVCLDRQDTWEFMKDAWFEAVGQLHNRGCELREKWAYVPAVKGNGLDVDSPFHGLFNECADFELYYIADVITRYMTLYRKHLEVPE